MMVSTKKNNKEDQTFDTQILDIDDQGKKVGVIGTTFLSSFSKDLLGWKTIGNDGNVKDHF